MGRCEYWSEESTAIYLRHLLYGTKNSKTQKIRKHKPFQNIFLENGTSVTHTPLLQHRFRTSTCYSQVTHRGTGLGTQLLARHRMSRCKHWSQEDITTPLLQQHILPTFNLLLSSHSPRHWIGHPVWARHHKGRCEHWSEDDTTHTASTTRLFSFQPSTLNSLTATTGLGT